MLYVTEETISVYIVDRGAGFDVEQAPAAGSSTGLAGMLERADLLGGTVSIDSVPGDGTTIHAQLSITQAIEMDAMAETEEEIEYGGWRTPQTTRSDTEPGMRCATAHATSIATRPETRAAIPSETCCGI